MSGNYNQLVRIADALERVADVLEGRRDRKIQCEVSTSLPVVNLKIDGKTLAKTVISHTLKAATVRGPARESNSE